MAKVGRFVVDPKAELFGLSSDRVFACDLETPEGRAALVKLRRGLHADSADATPLGAFVKYVKDCGTAADVRARCEALLFPR